MSDLFKYIISTINSNKQDGCRYAAALPAAQTPGSNRQDVYGQNGTCAPAQLASGPTERRRRNDHFLSGGGPAPRLHGPELSKRKGASVAGGSSSAEKLGRSARTVLADDVLAFGFILALAGKNGRCAVLCTPGTKIHFNGSVATKVT